MYSLKTLSCFFFIIYEHLGSENCYVNTYIDTPKTYKNTIISNY